jgi:hypothetical protein
VDLVVYDDKEQRYVPLPVALCAALLAALVVGGLTFQLARSQAGAAEPQAGVSQPQAGVSEPQAGVSEPQAGVSEPQAGVSEPQAGVSEPQAGVTDPQADPGEPGATCAPAIQRADAALELGDRLAGSLSEQTSLMDELLAERATADQVLDRALPPLTTGAKDRQAFLEALTAYQQARAECPEPSS